MRAGPSRSSNYSLVPPVRPPLVPAVTTLAAVVLLSGCWESVAPQAEGEVLGFRIGASKSDVFAAAIRSQKQGRILSLELVGLPPTTSAETYRGAPIALEDFERVATADTWHTSLPDCNCWLRLEFKNDSLVRVDHHEWTGPTK